MLRTALFALAYCGLFLLARPATADEPKPAAEVAPKPAAKNSPYGETAPADKAPPAPVLSQEELEKQFAETMSGATMIGNFTAGPLKVAEKADRPAAENGKDEKPKEQKPLKEDRYTLGKVAKIKDDYWLFETRIQYGEHDVTLPITIQIKWAGDTPILTLTDLTVPGLGTFTSRVLVYRGQYAGTWSHGDHGGQMFGRIVKAQKP